MEFRLALQAAVRTAAFEQCRADQSWDGRRRTSKRPCSGTPGADTEDVRGSAWSYHFVIQNSPEEFILNSKKYVLLKD